MTTRFPSPSGRQLVGVRLIWLLFFLGATLFFLSIVYLGTVIGLHSTAAYPGLANVRNFAAAVQSFLTVVAIGIGGTWTYYKFIKGRTLVRRLAAYLSCSATPAPGKVWYVAEVKIRNIGSVRVPLSDAFLLISPVTEGRPCGPKLAGLEEDTRKYDVLEFLGLKSQYYGLEPDEEMCRIITICREDSTIDLMRFDLFVDSRGDKCWSSTAIASILPPAGGSQQHQA